MVYLFLVSAPKTDPPSLLCQDRMAKDSDATEANEWRLMVASKRIWLSGSLNLLSCSDFLLMSWRVSGAKACSPETLGARPSPQALPSWCGLGLKTLHLPFRAYRCFESLGVWYHTSK